MKRYTLVLLDLDDTLLDFSKSQQCAFERTLDKVGMPFQPELFCKYKAINNELWTLYEQGAIPKDEIFIERWVRLLAGLDHTIDFQKINDAFLSDLSRHPIWLDGAESFFKRLVHEYRVAIVTNGHGATARLRLHGSGIADHSQGIIISDEVGFAKPHPMVFENALRTTGIEDKSSVLMIGDNIHADIGGALSFGIDACWYNPSGGIATHPIKPTFTARSHVEIGDWLGLM